MESVPEMDEIFFLSSYNIMNGNFGYDSVIGLNAVGPVENVGSIFSKIKLKK